ncbi:MAG: hypothetical protein AB4426_33605, partial [Xenococcaceae cyanobacterium]
GERPFDPIFGYIHRLKPLSSRVITSRLSRSIKGLTKMCQAARGRNAVLPALPMANVQELRRVLPLK